MKQEFKDKIQAVLGTLVVMALVLLLLWYVQLSRTPDVEDEGIEVAFGEEEFGGGQPDGLLAANTAPVTTAPPAQASAPSANELMTQEDEESLALARQRDEEERMRRQAEQERLIRERAEAERLEAERKERERVIAERRAKEQAQIEKANQLGALFGQTGSDEGAHGDAGETASSGAKGNPLGKGVSGGNSWSLAGRNLKGSLPKPSNEFKQEGKVVVNIVVDKEGKVVSATAGNGTTISDETTRQLAIKAAYKAEFDMGPDKAFGKITYYFKFK